MAAQLPVVEAELSPEFEDRRATWAAELTPSGEASQWALDRTVAASLQIERCEKAIEGCVADSRKRASLNWEDDRAVEAATTYGRLARDPVLASRQLRTSLAGARLLVEAWLGLATILKGGRDWSDVEASRALDLLGVDPVLRSGRTRIDPADDSDPIAFRLYLVLEELEALEARADEALAPLEEMDRHRALTGDAALLSKPAQLLLRYERDAWRRYRESMKEVKAPPAARVDPLPPVKLPPVPKPPQVAPKPKPSPEPEPSFEDERRALMAEAASFLLAAKAAGIASPMDDEDDWFEQLERRIDEAPATERSQLVAAG